MHLHTTHVVAGLLAAIAFCLAFMAAGVFFVSFLFMGLGLVAVGWLAWSLIRQVRSGSRNRVA
ncbi:hypothetical protein [uncultured Brevundimonas sp.]|uniref:hypothetical protein n=1 Tax=uncultured Brevundimonas sp. TaxID=213418 RepID=UPI0030EE2535|tara:strand:+ start:517 stop:705 length:189 start_codon:yes stop_codon:yes gene_type:complete